MLTFNDVETLVTSSSVGGSEQSLINMLRWDATCTVTDTTPGAKTFAFLSGNNFTSTAHGYLVGLKVRVSTSVTLPTGLTAGVDYYIIVINADVFAFASSQANALLGTAITISGAGSGVQTATPQALAGGTLVFQKNNVPSTIPNYSPVWFTITSPTTAATQNVTGAGTLNYYDPACGYHSMRALLTVTGGQATVSIRYNGKGF